MTLVSWLASAQVAIAALVLVLLVLERATKRVDAGTWHAAWTAVAVVALVHPALSLLVPAWLVIAPAGFAPASIGGESPSSSIAISWILRALPVIYGVGVGLLLVRLFAGWSLVRRLARQGFAVEGMWRTRLERLVGDESRLCRVHARVQVPVTVGWRRPVVLLPENWIAWEDARLRAVMRHELAHVRRGDYAWNIIAAFAQAAYWINPFAWILARKIRLRAELACDQDAARDLGAAVYAGVLVQSARELLRMGRRTTVLAPGAATSLEARIQALVGREVPSLRTSRKAQAGLALTLALVVFATMLVRVADASSLRSSALVGPNHAAAHEQRHAARH